jgi:hypothetical protein
VGFRWDSETRCVSSVLDSNIVRKTKNELLSDVVERSEFFENTVKKIDEFHCLLIDRLNGF